MAVRQGAVEASTYVSSDKPVWSTRGPRMVMLLRLIGITSTRSLPDLNLPVPALAAAILRATTIQPGRFNPRGTIVAVYLLATGVTGLSILGIPLWVINVFNGGALAITIS